MKRYFLSAAIGVAIGFLAWGYPPFSLPFSLLLPFVWARSGNRAEAFCLAFGYGLFYAADIPFSVENFFPRAPRFFGYAIWAADAALVAAPWALAWHPRHPLSARVLLLSLLALLPPFGMFSWGGPFVAAGALFPGYGAAGVVLMGISIYLSAEAGRLRYRLAPTLAVVATAVISNLLWTPPALPDRWISASTELGKLDQDLASARTDRYRALRQVADAAIAAGATVVLFPEEVAPDWADRWENAWAITSQKASRAGAKILIGADERKQDGVTVTDSLMLLGGKTIEAWHSARVPMPLGAWRPWSSISVVASPFDFPARTLQGKAVAVSICYEDFLLWPHARALFERPDVMLSAANNWMVKGRPAEQRQRVSIEMTARLVGAPLLRAVNR